MEHGAQRRGNTHDRLAYARALWIEDPKIPIDGPTGMIRKLYDRYGETASPGALEVVRREARMKRATSGQASTNVGAKVAEAIAAKPAAAPVLAVVHTPPAPLPVVEAPAKTRAKPKPSRTLPPGWKNTERINERREFARGVFMQRPDIRLSGNDSMEDLLVSRFGVGVSVVELERIRAEVKARGADPAAAAAPAPAAPIQTTPTPEPDRPIDVAEVLSTLATMAMEAIPSLAQLTVKVNAAGEAEVAYTVRETRVVEQSGSLTVARRT